MIIILSIFIVISFISPKEEVLVYGDFEYRFINTNEIEITKYTGTSKNIEIPNKIENNYVTYIGDLAFEYLALSSVLIPDSVVTIGFGAFAGNNLTSVIIPSSVKVIEGQAFSDNNLTSIELSSNVNLQEKVCFKIIV